MTTQTSTNNNGALDGIRVLELGTLIAGPFCGQLLGDMGAEVIKIEPPKVGDAMRRWGRTDPPVAWSIISRNKKSVTVNLREPEGQDLIRRLCRETDILVENFRPGTMERWGLGYSDLKAVNPKLIMVRVSGYGQTGPYAKRAGFGSIAEAMGGLRYLTGDPTTPPSRIGISIGDMLAANFATIGALSALHHREKTGLGQEVDVAIYESVLAMMESTVPEYTVSQHIRERTGSILPNVAPSNVYQCKDGEFLIGANQDTVFKRLCRAMQRDDLAEHEDYATHTARGRNMDALDDIINNWTQTLTVAELELLMDEFGVPAGKMYRAPDMLEDPHFKAREAIVDIDHPTADNFKMQNVFPKMSLTPGQIKWTGPALGEHRNEVLTSLLNMTNEEIEKLESADII